MIFAHWQKGGKMLDIKEYLKQTKTVLLTSDAFDELMQRAYAQPEIVRCKECVYADENYHCDYMTTWNYGDCFCSYGKRRNDERSD